MVAVSSKHDNEPSYEGVSKLFRTDRLERELQMVEPSATRCSYIAILWVSLVRFAAITLCVASQRVFIVVVYFVIDSVRKLLVTPSYSIKGRENLLTSWVTNRFLITVLRRVIITRFEVFAVVKIQVEVFQVVTSCSVTLGYQRCTWRHNPEDLELNYS
jgi:hypothetical protein